MTNTINNVPRELLAELQEHIHCHHDAVLWGKVCDLLSAPSPAGVGGLDTDRNAAFKACPESGCDWGSFYLGWKARGEVEQAIIDGLRGEVADLHTTMMAAAVEIQEHWAAHCDEEGYGPANLMHRLERGIASQYGYSAETLVRLESQRDQHAQRIGELEGLLRHAQKQVPTGSGLHMRIDAALSAGKGR